MKSIFQFFLLIFSLIGMTMEKFIDTYFNYYLQTVPKHKESYAECNIQL